MRKNELINILSKSDINLTKKTTFKLVDCLFNEISKIIISERKFSYPGFGTFIVRSRKARKGRDPRTGVEINIKASSTVGFKPAKGLKTQL